MYRATAIEYANRKDLLSGAGSALMGARWTPQGGQPTIYGSLTPQAALLESLGTGGRYGIPNEQRLPLVMVAVDVQLQAVLDLSLPVVRKSLRLSQVRMLTEDWEAIQRTGSEAITQAVGRDAYELGYDGLLAPSARLKGEQNMVIFAGNLRRGALKVQNVGKLPEPK
jgi:RES domain-containing protein